MAYEIRLEDRTAQIEVLNRVGSKALIAVDGKKYEVDILMVEKGVYSILYNGRSFNVELIESEEPKKYVVNTFARSFNAEIIDAESKYISSRNKGSEATAERMIMSPMPGKVIRVLVKPGEEVQAGQNLVVVEAMKMQSEFKASADHVVAEVLVKEGDTVNANQLMVRLD
jgi:biotin carboxyl carrier protein